MRGEWPSWLAEQHSFLELRRRLTDGHVVPFVGAGASAALRMPGWEELIRALEAAANAGAPDGAAIRQKVDDAPLRAQQLRGLLGSGPYHDVLRRTFQLGEEHRRTIDESPLFGALSELPCLFWLTTNYDAALEHALRDRKANRPADGITWSTVGESDVNAFIASRHRRAKRRAVIHLHGSLEDPESIVLTESDYQYRYWYATTERMRLATILSTRSALFTCTSMKDEDLRSVLREVRARFRSRNQQGQHFWLHEYETDGTPAGWEATAPERAREVEHWRVKFGVEVIHFPVPNMDFSALATVLRSLNDSPAVLARRAVEATKQPTEPGPVTVRADPQKGRFGGSPRRDRFVLSGDVDLVDERGSWCRVRLKIRGPAGPNAPDRVTWYLHDTFKPDVISGAFHGREAALEVMAYGAFTVGALVQRPGAPPVLLELDLAEAKGAPPSFLSR